MLFLNCDYVQNVVRLLGFLLAVKNINLNSDYPLSSVLFELEVSVFSVKWLVM